MVAFFRPGDAGDLADRVRALYRDADLRAQLACGSRKFVRRYCWEVVGKQYVDLVAGLGAGAPTRRVA
jgi:hypothetical protein